MIKHTRPIVINKIRENMCARLNGADFDSTYIFFEFENIFMLDKTTATCIMYDLDLHTHSHHNHCELYVVRI